MMNLLLVDDQTSVLEGMLNGVDFESLGYTKVYTAVNAADAIKICEENSIMVLVTDIEMPGQSGIERIFIASIPFHYPHRDDLSF